MKVAALQMVATPDVPRNLDAAARLVAQAAAQGAQLAVLPEYFCLMGHSDRDKLALAEADGQGPIQTALAAMARTNKLWLVGGTLPLQTPNPDKVRNACCVHAPDGQRVARYDKIHLFRFSHGGESYDESRVLEPGDQPVTFQATVRGEPTPAGEASDSHAWRVGLSICYDLRFPELYRTLMRDAPCDILTVPAAFTHTTGLAHWELLLRARAVENQCFVIAAAQGGTHENGRRTFGHSMVVGPWGEVLAVRREDGEGVVMVDIGHAHTHEVRTRLPALEHRQV
jgi:deaminated glutathione amidase